MAKKGKLIVRININGQLKRFTAPKFVSGEVFKRTLALEKDFNNSVDYNLIFKKCYPLICEIFGYQFTVQQLERGFDVKEVLALTHRSIDYVISHMNLDKKGISPIVEGRVLLFERIRDKKSDY